MFIVDFIRYLVTGPSWIEKKTKKLTEDREIYREAFRIEHPHDKKPPAEDKGDNS